MFFILGAFGGALEEDGFVDPLALLLIYKELIKRHTHFLNSLIRTSSESEFENELVKINICKLEVERFIKEVFTDFNNERAEKKTLEFFKQISISCI